jgi:hypothetical protein
MSVPPDADTEMLINFFCQSRSRMRRLQRKARLQGLARPLKDAVLNSPRGILLALPRFSRMRGPRHFMRVALPSMAVLGGPLSILTATLNV